MEDVRKLILGYIVGGKSLSLASSDTYLNMKLLGRSKKHPIGTGKTTSRRKGKVESEYKLLVSKHLFIKEIMEIRSEYKTWNLLPKNNSDIEDYCKRELNVDDRDINSSLYYFKKKVGVELVRNSNGLYSFVVENSKCYDDLRCSNI